ncbi:MAG: restriction endonuclease [Bacillota bacterium]
MAKFFSTGRRLFRLDMEKWREMRRKGRYLRYYIKPVRDDRNKLARNIDFYGVLLVAMLVTLALAESYSGSHARALVVSVTLMAAEVYIAFKLRKFFLANAGVHNRLWAAGRQCLERIKNIGDAEDLEKLFVEILGKIDGFTDVYTVNAAAGEKDLQDTKIAIRALYRGVPLAVRCLATEPGDSAVAADKVTQFRDEIRNLDIRGGVLVAAGTFSPEARRAALEEKIRITLVDAYRLVELARQTGHRIFPAVTGDTDSGRENRALMYRRMLRIALGREKARGYLFAAGTMLAMYSLTLAADVFSPGYLVFGIINIGLSLYCLLSNRESDLLGPVN